MGVHCLLLVCLDFKGENMIVKTGANDGRYQNEATIRKRMKKKILGPDQEEKPALTMGAADKGVGALYVVMDAIRRRHAEKKEKEEKERHVCFNLRHGESNEVRVAEFRISQFYCSYY